MSSDLKQNPTAGMSPVELEPELKDLVSEWQFAQIRLERLMKNQDLAREWALVGGLLALVFAAPAVTWVRRWTLPGSIQPYALFVLPMAAVWVWLARWKLVAPEVDSIRQALRFERRTRMAPPNITDREKTVLKTLLESPPAQDTRSRKLLVLATLLCAVAFWLRDPSLTFMAFMATVAGIVAYRHGRWALRAAMFPLLMLLFMVPLPGPASDAIVDRAEPFILNISEHLANNAGAHAEVQYGTDPIIVTAHNQSYLLFSEHTGLCITESVFVFILTLFYLSLIRTPNLLPKIGVLVATAAACFALMIGRITLLCWVSNFDRDITALLEGFTTYLVPIGSLALAYLLCKGLKCVKYHRWVSFSLKP